MTVLPPAKSGWGAPTQHVLKQLVGLVNELIADEVRLRSEFVRSRRTLGINVQNSVAVGDQPIGDEHAVATEVNTFGTHVGGTAAAGEFDELGNAVLECRCQHVIGVVAKAGATQAEVGGVVSHLLAASSELFHPDVLDPRFRQCFFERFAIEMRQATGTRERANVNQSLNAV